MQTRQSFLSPIMARHQNGDSANQRRIIFNCHKLFMEILIILAQSFIAKH
jgi:hypothetical protein